MDLTKEGRFFPNECYICRSRENLIRCRCNFISYCGDEHQRQHWPVHENFCNAIMSLLKEKGLTHIYKKLLNEHRLIFSSEKEKMRQELILKLGRPMSPLEEGMFCRPRNCYDCFNVEQNELINCPGCPIMSFCKLHINNDNYNHSDNCPTMRKYLNLLNTAEKLNIDMQFLSSKFPFTSKNIVLIEDRITDTLRFENVSKGIHHSKLTKNNLLDFISSASELHLALKKIYGTIPEEIVIHIDALSSQHVFMNENYWEFLLHYNQGIKMLKIVVIGCQNKPIFKTSLCDTCSLKKTLQFEFNSLSYEDYTLQQCYKKPDVIYSAIQNGINCERPIRWAQFGYPVVLKYDSKNDFDRTIRNLELRPSTYKIIYQGQISTEFSDENDANYVIFISNFNRYGNKIIPNKVNESVLVSRDAKSDAKTTQVSEENPKDEKNSKVVEQNPNVEGDLKVGEQNSNVEADSKSGENPNVEANPKIEENPNVEAAPKVAEKNAKVEEHPKVVASDSSSTIHLESGSDHSNPENVTQDLKPEEKESVSSSQDVEVENQEVIPIEAESSKIQENCNADGIVDPEEKLEDLETLSTSSSSSSFIVISKSRDIDPDAEAEIEKSEDEKSSESRADDFNDEKSGTKDEKSSKSRENFNGVENEENEILIANREAEKIDKECQVTICENVDSENHSNITESFLLKHNSFLKNENARLREHLSCSVEEISELQNKILELQQICSNLVTKNKILKETVCDIEVDINSALEKRIFKIQ